MEKIIFENAMLELVKDTLDMAKPEHALLSAIGRARDCRGLDNATRAH